MKKICLFFLLVTAACFGSAQSANIIELPLVPCDTISAGWSMRHFDFGYYGYFLDKTPQAARLQVKNIPADWTDVKQGEIDTDPYQSAYQYFMGGYILPDEFAEVQKRFHGNTQQDLASGRLSPQMLKTRVALVSGRDKQGWLAVMVDTDNDLDMGNERPYHPVVAGEFYSPEDRAKDEFWKRQERITYQFPIKDGWREAKTHLSIGATRGGDLSIGFFSHWTVEFGGRRWMVSSDMGARLLFERVYLMPDGYTRRMGFREDFILSAGEYLSSEDGMAYRIKGADRANRTLLLEETGKPIDQVTSTQVGFSPRVFTGTDLVSGERISLSDYRGKYVLFDAYTTNNPDAAKNVVERMKQYKELDHTKIEFISVIGYSKLDAARKLIEQTGATWPQIFDTQATGILERYNVNTFPTVWLIDPQGRIVTKNPGRQMIRDLVEGYNP